MKFEFESLAKENAGIEGTDEEFQQAIGISFRDKIDVSDPVMWSLWQQLRHAYGFTVDSICNSKHRAQFDREWAAKQ